MIVKCENCQTRFRIPDEKVTEKGVKVRCTKCAHTFRVSKAPAASEAAPSADPFAQFAPAEDPPMDQATRPGFYAHGIVASKPAPGARPQTSAPADLSDLFGSAPEPAAPAPPAPVATRRGESPQGSAGEDFSSVFNAPTRVAAVPPAEAGRASAAAAADLSRAVNSVPPPAPQSSAPLELDHGGADPFAAQPSGLLGDLPAPDDLFGGLTGPQAQLTSSGSFGLDGSVPDAGPDRGLFDLPQSPPETASGGPESFGMFGQEAAEQQASEAPPEPTSVPVATVPRPVGRPEDARGLQEAKRAGAARRLSGLVANVSVAALLVGVLLTVGSVYLNEGKLDLSQLSWEQARELFTPPATLVTRDVSNGLYETRQGRPVFYVRGEVENRSDRKGKARVRAEILDGETLVRAAEGLAGKVPTPEELHAVQSAEDLQGLAKRLNQGAAEVAPGERISFLVAFYEYPPDLAGYRLRVTVVPEDEAAASR